MHRAHTRHEERSLEPPIFEHIERIFSMTDRGVPSIIDRHILVTVKPTHFLERHAQGLCGHGTEIVRAKALPAWLFGQIQRRLIDEPRRLESHPGSPIQLDPRPAQCHCAIAYIDRKSTRLNSSHLGISYAVFCLKKKNTTNTTTKTIETKSREH